MEKAFKLLILLVIFGSCNQKSENRDVAFAFVEQQKTCDYTDKYYPLIYKAEREYYLGNYDKAFELYSKAFETCEPKNSLFHYEMDKFTELSTRLGKSDLALDFMERTLKNGNILKLYVNDSLYHELLQSERGKKLIQNYDTIRKEYLAGLNLELRKEIQEMIAADQRYRRNQVDFAANKGKVDSIDKVHEKRLIEIFEEIGYPDEEMIGGFTVDFSSADVSVLVLHTDDSIRMNYFVPKLMEFVKEGIMPPQTFGAIVDQYHNYNNDPQIYGTYGTEGGKYAYMIDDLSKVDSNRISIGLPPLALQEELDSLKNMK